MAIQNAASAPAESITFKKQGQAKEILRRLRKDKGAMVGLAILIVLVLVIVFADQIAPYEMSIKQDVFNKLQPPSAEHIMGTDTFGRDVLARLLPERTGKVTGGNIRFEGRELTGLPEADMRNVRGDKIAMIFQDPMTSLNPVLTVGEQIGEALAVHNEAGRTKEQIEQRVDETLTMVGIPPSRKHEYPHQFTDV